MNVRRAWLALTAVGMMVFASRGDDQAVLLHQLQAAIKSGDLASVKKIVAQTPGIVNVTYGKDPRAALHWAASYNQVEIASFLLQNKSQVNLVHKDHDATPIFFAKTKRMASLLIKHGADIHVRAKSSRQTPLQHAVMTERKGVAKALADAGAKVDFDSAVALGWTKIVAKKLKKKPWQVKLPRTPLHTAAAEGHYELVKLLLDQGADVNAEKKDAIKSLRYTPLSAAVENHHLEIAKLLLEHGADANVSSGDFNRENLLRYAIVDFDTAFIRSLLVHGADVSADLETDTFTPLHVATAAAMAPDGSYPQGVGESKSELDKVRLLLEFGADPNARTTAGVVPLHLAALRRRRDVCDLLLKNGARLDVYTACGIGNTSHVKEMLKSDRAIITELQRTKPHRHLGSPLHWAAYSGDASLVRLLLGRGAFVNSRAPLWWNEWSRDFQLTSNGKEKNVGSTPLHIAAALGHTDIVRLLIQAGANVNIHRVEGDDHLTPLDLACRMRRYAVVKELLKAKVKYDRSDLIRLSDRDARLLKLLLEARTEIDLRGKPGSELIASVIGSGDSSIVDLLLARRAPLDIYSACALGRIKEVRRLLPKQRAAAINVDPNAPRWPPIVLAANYGHADVVEFLHQSGAPIDARLNHWSALHSAAERGHPEVIDFFLGKGLGIEAKNTDGETVLHGAIRGAQEHTVRHLLAKKANIHATNDRGIGALHILAQSRRFDAPETKEAAMIWDRRLAAVAGLLIKAGAKVNAASPEDETPLHYAVYFGWTRLAIELMDAGADVNARSKRGETPLTYAEAAAKNGRVFPNPSAMLELLRKRGGAP